jgi:hypothetical protein
MSLDEDYPKTNRKFYSRLLEVLKRDPQLSQREREELAMALDDMADKACDLDEIIQRLLDPHRTDEEVGELLLAVEMTTEQLRGDSDVIDGKLYDIGDRLRGVETTEADN